MNRHKLTLAIALMLVCVVLLGWSFRPKLKCSMCSRGVKAQTIHLLKLNNNEVKLTCCSHCGLMFEKKLGKKKKAKEQVKLAYATDYETGEFVKAEKAYYVKDSNVIPCCVPSILAFATRERAETFQRENKGKLLTFEEIMAGPLHK